MNDTNEKSSSTRESKDVSMPSSQVGQTASPPGSSCVGCKFLYSEGTGYSNYTWEDDEVRCALDRNPLLPSLDPWDWTKDAANDNWPATQHQRCESYASGPFVRMDVDLQDGPADFTSDRQQIIALCEHSGRGLHGFRDDDATKEYETLKQSHTLTNEAPVRAETDGKGELPDGS